MHWLFCLNIIGNIKKKQWHSFWQKAIGNTFYKKCNMKLLETQKRELLEWDSSHPALSGLDIPPLLSQNNISTFSPYTSYMWYSNTLFPLCFLDALTLLCFLCLGFWTSAFRNQRRFITQIFCVISS